MTRKEPSRIRAYKELTLQQLRSFHIVCRDGSYAAAAESLMLTPPAVWEQLQALERHYGVQLMERFANGMRPTKEGERLLELTRPVLADLDSSREILRQEQGSWPGMMTVATNLRVFAAEISQGISRFQRAHPETRLRLSFLRDEPLAESILSGDTDVGITLEPGPGGMQRGLQHDVIGDIDYLLVTPRRHPLASQSRIRLPDIVRHPLVLGDEVAYSRRRVQEVFHRHRLIDDMHVAVETNSDEYSIHCARAGMGCAITVGTSSAALFKNLHVISLREWFGNVRIGFVRLKGTNESPAQKNLAGHIAAALRLQPAANVT